MVVLRSHEVHSNPPKPKSKPEPKRATPEPETPVRIGEGPAHQQSPPTEPGSNNTAPPAGSTLRRSLRLAGSVCGPGGDGGSNRDIVVRKEGRGKCKVFDEIAERGSGDVSLGRWSLRSGKNSVKRKLECGSVGFGLNGSSKVGKAKARGVVEGVCLDNAVVEGVEREEGLVEIGENGGGGRSGSRRKRDAASASRGGEGGCDVGSSTGRRRYSVEDKGKGKLEPDSTALDPKITSLENKLTEMRDLVGKLAESIVIEEAKKHMEVDTRPSGSRMQQYKNIARKNASRFAHFEVVDEEEAENDLLPPGEVEMTSIQEEAGDVGDWPGPFCTAMKIIRDRANKNNSAQNGTSTSGKAGAVPIMWTPKNNRDSNRSKSIIPSLQELCMPILVENADAITSLENVPDAIRNRLCRFVCDARKMNSHIFNLLVSGSPSEICIWDCSWLTEEDFLKCFEGCDTRNLRVLQLDQCGRCFPDFVVSATLAHSLTAFSALTTLSLSGACRLSDKGLSSLVSSTPVLKSINLGQCSLLTATGIDALASSLGMVLKELRINDCQSIDVMLILPALRKLEQLEVLSVAGIPTVSDNFVRQLVAGRGHTLKELILTDCGKLTDSSLKAIADRCPNLCALDLFNVRKLTDSALGYLANGGQEIKSIKLCRNTFSDEAIAAFIETSGEHLQELSLNNVIKVSNNTAVSIARRGKNLRSLDLSWCRNMSGEAVGLIVDSCPSLRVLKLFGCGQITKTFLYGHSNGDVRVVGLNMSPILEGLRDLDLFE